MLWILCAGPFRADEGSFQMHACNLCVRHFSSTISADFGEYLVNSRLGSGHGCSQHCCCSLGTMELSDGIQRFSITVHKIVASSTMNMYIYKSGDQKIRCLTTGRPMSVTLWEPSRIASIVDLLSRYGNHTMLN